MYYYTHHEQILTWVHNRDEGRQNLDISLTIKGYADPDTGIMQGAEQLGEFLHHFREEWVEVVLADKLGFIPTVSNLARFLYDTANEEMFNLVKATVMQNGKAMAEYSEEEENRGWQ